MTDSPLTSVRIVHYQRYEADESCASGELPILFPGALVQVMQTALLVRAVAYRREGNPCSCAHAAAAVRVDTPILAKILAR